MFLRSCHAPEMGKRKSDNEKEQPVSKRRKNSGSVKKLKNNVTEQHLTEVGCLLWSTFNRRHWPCVVVSHEDVGVPPAKTDKVWVLWLDHKSLVSEVKIRSLHSFTENYNSLFKNSTASTKLHASVLRALQECRRRCSMDEDGDLFTWAEQGFKVHGKSQRALYKPPTGMAVFPPWIESRMEQLRVMNETDSDESSDDEEDDDDNDSDDDEEEQAMWTRKEQSWSQVKQGVINVEEMCLSCGEICSVAPHPVFKGGCCFKCKEDLTDALLLKDYEDIYMYCVVCGGGGTMVLCHSTACSRSFCQRCVSLFGGPDEADRVKTTDPWLCYLCTDTGRTCVRKTRSTSASSGSFGLEPRQKWKQNAVNFCLPLFRGMEWSQSLDRPPHHKRPIRVLSLFDGLGSGRLVLDKLDLEVEIYFACEVEKAALLVTNSNLQDKIVQLGDVRKLSTDKLSALVPIDLLIGGSPCNELSIANPDRRGLGAGSGLLFFEFCRILYKLEAINPADRPLFWLFENVASMDPESKTTISRFLRVCLAKYKKIPDDFKCEANLWDAQYVSAQKRRRYFWGNIPSICSAYDRRPKQHKLQDVLFPSRHAKVDKINCITTQMNSLVRGKETKTYPVQMGKEEDVIWIPEVERIFGFPEHYTDVGNMGITQRMRLLGRSWSLPVICKILLPLKTFFSPSKTDKSPSK